MPSRSSGVDLLRPAAEAVVAAVGEARFAEPAVATGRRPADRPRLDEGDARAGIAAAREESRPQPGVAASDDHEVDVVVADEGAPSRLRGEVVEPEHAVPRFGETASMTDAAGRCRSKTVVPTDITSLSLGALHPRAPGDAVRRSDQPAESVANGCCSGRTPEPERPCELTPGRSGTRT